MESPPRSDGAGRRLRPEELRRRRPHLVDLADLPRRPLVVVVENVRSLFNVGSILRTADGVRAEQVLLCGYTGHPPRDEIEKTALGAEDAVPWSYWSRAPQALAALRDDGWQIVALELTTGSVPLPDLELQSRVALVVGNEITGVSDEALALCHAAVELPMDGLKESLNVAVAFGVAAYGVAARLPLPLASPRG